MYHVYISFAFRSDDLDSNRLRPHLLRTSDYCWCDKDALNHFAEVQDLTLHTMMHPWHYIVYMYRFLVIHVLLGEHSWLLQGQILGEGCITCMCMWQIKNGKKNWHNC